MFLSLISKAFLRLFCGLFEGWAKYYLGLFVVLLSSVNLTLTAETGYGDLFSISPLSVLNPVVGRNVSCYRSGEFCFLYLARSFLLVVLIFLCGRRSDLCEGCINVICDWDLGECGWEFSTLFCRATADLIILMKF